MTKQEAFDTVATHLLAQGTRSTDLAGRCFYRSPTGLKCAVGALIPDKLYNPLLEGFGVVRLLKAYPSLGEHLGESAADLDFLVDLQCVHDNHRPADWHSELQTLAHNHNLEFHA